MNLTENKTSMIHFFAKYTPERLDAKSVANVNNNNSMKVLTKLFCISIILNIKLEKEVTKSNRTYAKMRLKLRCLQ